MSIDTVRTEPAASCCWPPARCRSSRPPRSITDGVICNVNADDAAAALAGALGAHLVLLTDTDGVWDADGQRIPTLSVAASERLIDEGVIAGGMVPKVRCALRAIGRWRPPGRHRGRRG